MIELSWFIAGIMLGIGVAAICIAVYGDAELNEKIHNIRQARLDLAKAKFEYKIKKWLYKDYKNVNLVVTPKEHKDS